MAYASELFRHLNFLIVVTEKEKLEAAKSTANILNSHACNRCEIYEQYLANDRLKNESIKSWFIRKYGYEDVIHFVISESCDFLFYHVAAFDFMIPVVTPEWVYICISTKRHHRTSGFSPDKRHIFKEFQIYVSRHSFSNSEYLCYTEMVHAMGGTCIDFLSNRTTHLVTKDSNDPGIKAVVDFGKITSIKFVYPTWIVQSYKELTVASGEQHAVSTDTAPGASDEKLQDMWSTVSELEFKDKSNILEGRSFIIGLDVSLGKDLYATVIEFLQANGGTVIRHVDENDIKSGTSNCYIGASNLSKEYETAMDVGLQLGNLIWIFYMWSFKAFTSPSSKMIFTPFKKKIYETSELILSYTNYYGQQRFYIQRLAELLGGFSTAELSRKNTHLVSQLPWGKKFETAKKWKERCVVINHCWLEESYKSGSKINPLDVQFQEYPVSGGLRRSLGQCASQDKPQESSQDSYANTDHRSEGPTDDLVISLSDRERELRELEESRMAPEAHKFIEIDEKEQELDYLATREQGSQKLSDPMELYEEPQREKAIVEIEDVSIQDCLPSRSEDLKQYDDPDLAEAEDLKLVSPPRYIKEATPLGEELQKEENANALNGNEQLNCVNEDNSKRKSESLLGSPQAAILKESASIVRESSLPRTETTEGSLTPSQTIMSSGSSRRAAKAKAAERLCNDIESLNEFQKNVKRKRTGTLLPEEIAQMERSRLLEQEAKVILSRFFSEEDMGDADKSGLVRRGRQLYHMDAICTGSHEDIRELDRILLKMLGIRIYDDITTVNSKKLNTIIAPKKMRTAKFLKSFSFHPLRHALKPEFFNDLLAAIHGDKMTGIQELSLELSKYTIPEIDSDHLLKMTSLPTKIFERAGISNINLVSDVTGGVDVISSILKAHGIKKVKIVQTLHMNKLTVDDLLFNEVPKRKMNEGTRAPECIMIATKSSQVKHFKRLLKGSCTTAMAVEWNWCISSIFGLDVDYSNERDVIYRLDENSVKRTHAKATRSAAK